MVKTQENGCALQLIDVVKVYGEGVNAVQALKGINLTFRKNEFVSILGPSGCGKTTMLNIIGGLDRYTSGDLIIDGKSTKEYKDSDWDAYRNNSIGFVFQSYNLIPHQTVIANVELALTLSGVGTAERHKRAKDVLERVGLSGQENKKPNQLSGGQMQRVAIARALINNPEIILADEPTGALDTETSVQVMDLLQEVAKDRLVIMVTHNPELAERYSTRIIKCLDGEVVEDTAPVEDLGGHEKKKDRRPKMKFKTALSLSLKNLISKKARTVLTSVAGSIGIIGVALVLSLSNGFNAYMARMQTDTLSTYPLQISESSIDLSSFSEMDESQKREKYPELNNVLVEKAFEKLTGMLESNDLTDKSENGFAHYLEKHKAENPEFYYNIAYSYGFDMNDYFYTDIAFMGAPTLMAIDTLVNNIQSNYDNQLESAIGLNTGFVRQYIPTIQEMPDYKLIKEQYDVLKGELPEFNEANKNKIVLVVDNYNGLSDISLALLGYLGVEGIDGTNVIFQKDENGNEITTIDLDTVMNKKFYLADNSEMYKKDDSGKYYTNLAVNKDNLKELEIVGILRCKKNVNGILQVGLAYMPDLVKEVLSDNANSEILQAKNSDGVIPIYNPKFNFMTMKMEADTSSLKENLTTRKLAGDDTPAEIRIFAKDFESKEQIKAYIDSWNDSHAENEELQITYSDVMSMVFSTLTTMVDAVTYVLIAFTSISLVVSSAMIGIITYTSVVERTKEIGVLRALGASKRDISNVFNAETFLIGLLAGLIGVGVTYLLCIPINIILSSLVKGVGTLAMLKITDALILIVVSFALTLIAGVIPARIAAKKDPVVALRTE